MWKFKWLEDQMISKNHWVKHEKEKAAPCQETGNPLRVELSHNFDSYQTLACYFV